MIISFLALLIAISAIYNAYLLKGGKLAWSEIYIVLGMVSLIFSLILPRFLPDFKVLNFSVNDLLFVLGFVFLLFATFKLRSSLK